MSNSGRQGHASAEKHTCVSADQFPEARFTLWRTSDVVDTRATAAAATEKDNWNSDDEAYDEFGRKKRKFRKGAVKGGVTKSQSASDEPKKSSDEPAMDRQSSSSLPESFEETLIRKRNRAQMLCKTKNQASTQAQDVKELCERFRIDDNLRDMLQSQLRFRSKTVDGDLETIEASLTQAKSASAQLTFILDEMHQGTFVSNPPNHDDIQAMKTKFNLDPSCVKMLTEQLRVMEKPKAKHAIRQMTDNLECCSKPSALAMFLIKRLQIGQEIGECTMKAAPGSYFAKKVANARGAREK